MSTFRLVYHCLFLGLVFAPTISWDAANACGTYIDYGSIYVLAETRDDLSEEDRRKCKIGALGAMLCVSTGYLEQDSAVALVAEVLRDAESSGDPRLGCMGRELSKRISVVDKSIRLSAEFKRSDFYPRGRQLFETICSRANLYDHPPFGVRLVGPAQVAAEVCSQRLGAGQQ
jgi:hypothetical protein